MLNPFVSTAPKPDCAKKKNAAALDSVGRAGPQSLYPDLLPDTHQRRGPDMPGGRFASGLTRFDARLKL
jgi:hypothetical protein